MALSLECTDRYGQLIRHEPDLAAQSRARYLRIKNAAVQLVVGELDASTVEPQDSFSKRYPLSFNSRHVVSPWLFEHAKKAKALFV